MLGNCDDHDHQKKMLFISSTTNEWSQPQNPIDEKSLMVSTTELIMKKPGQETPQKQPPPPPQQLALKCPRCDSSNTKFCYYNNYSLSQPRHFCKACKRYWTRGGTLRNVPVGGGCRKNKRVKKPSSASVGTIFGVGASSTTSAANPNPVSSQIDINPLFYGLPSNPSDMNLSFPARLNSRSETNVSGFDLQSQLNALALGFSSGIISNEHTNNGFSSSLLSSYNSILGSSSSTRTTSPTMATLLASSLHQQKFTNGGGIKETSSSSPPNNNHFQNLTPFEDLQMLSGNNEARFAMKEVKVEADHNNNRLLMDWNNVIPCPNQTEQIGYSSSSDPSLFYWNTTTNTTSVGAWHDPGNNIGSSVTSLI